MQTRAIEVEQKFPLKPTSEESLVRDAEFVGQRSFTDTYYDDVDYTLTTQGIWLRNRDGRFELKLPLPNPGEDSTSNQYKEIETEQDIADHFGWDLANHSFGEHLVNRGLVPVISFTTTRRKYKMDRFVIDIDTTDFDFGIIEIERMVEHEDEIAETAREINAFAAQYGLETGYIRGKVLEYLRRKNPAHLDALINAGVAQ